MYCFYPCSTDYFRMSAMRIAVRERKEKGTKSTLQSHSVNKVNNNMFTSKQFSTPMSLTHPNNSPAESATSVLSVYIEALLSVVMATLLVASASHSTVLNQLDITIGRQSYAERQPSWAPDWLPMPFSTAIITGYAICCAGWTFVACKSYKRLLINSSNLFIFFAFNTMGLVHGFIHLCDVLGQTRGSAVLDQWYTLPFFMLVYIWAQSCRGVCSRAEGYVLQAVSVGSYSLRLLSPVGFQVSLACHVIIAFVGAVAVYRENRSLPARRCLISVSLFCAGFVILKLTDHRLARLHQLFGTLSSHFVSSFCDVLQIHCVNLFFYNICLSISATRKRYCFSGD